MQTLYLKVNHFAGLRCLWALAGVQHRDTVLLDLLLQVPEFTLHLVAAAHLIDKLALERVDVRIELNCDKKSI